MHLVSVPQHFAFCFPFCLSMGLEQLLLNHTHFTDILTGAHVLTAVTQATAPCVNLCMSWQHHSWLHSDCCISHYSNTALPKCIHTHTHTINKDTHMMAFTVIMHLILQKINETFFNIGLTSVLKFVINILAGQITVGKC